MIFCACLLSSSRITINITQSNDLVEKLDNQDSLFMISFDLFANTNRQALLSCFYGCEN